MAKEQSKDITLDKNYWETRYLISDTGWDLGKVSPPIKRYIDTLENKNARILIPGCGNTYEAEYLLLQGFTNITVIDIAPTLVKNLRDKFEKYTSISVILGDFFEHHEEYDLIIEQTFFCALPPNFRENYVAKMHKLLSNDGILAGLLFDKTFEAGPPFGGSKSEYESLFSTTFHFINFDMSDHSIPKRANSELFFEFKKKI
jgi:SAM-dependent methyltransferase